MNLPPSVRAHAVIVTFAMFSSGCVSLSPIGAAHLAATDPLAVDPAAISVAIELPSTLHIRDGDATLQMKIGGRLDETFVLHVEGTIGGVAPTGGRHVLAAGIAQRDWTRFARAQAEARNARERDGKGRGSLTVSITGACRTGDVDDGPVPTAISIRTAERYVPLARIDLAATIGTAKLKQLPTCDARPQRA